MKLGSLRVRVGEQVRRGQVIGQVGYAGNSDEQHLHLQVQNKPTFDIEDRDIRTHPILGHATETVEPVATRTLDIAVVRRHPTVPRPRLASATSRWCRAAPQLINRSLPC